MKYVFLFLILIVMGCADETLSVQQADNPIAINVLFVDSPNEVDKLYNEIIVKASPGSIVKEALKPNDYRDGFHYKKGDINYIVLAKPDAFRYTEFERLVGHEMNHVLFGRFHNENGDLPYKIALAGNLPIPDT